MGNSRRDRRVRILLDTSMLLTMAEGVNVLDQIEESLATKPEYIVLTPIIEELRKLMNKGSPTLRKKAKFALKIVYDKCRIVEYKGKNSRRTDDIILEYALENPVIVATNDRELRRRLRKHGIPEIYLREEKMMVEINGVLY